MVAEQKKRNLRRKVDGPTVFRGKKIVGQGRTNLKGQEAALGEGRHRRSSRLGEGREGPETFYAKVQGLHWGETQRSREISTQFIKKRGREIEKLCKNDEVFQEFPGGRNGCENFLKVKRGRDYETRDNWCSEQRFSDTGGGELNNLA